VKPQIICHQKKVYTTACCLLMIGCSGLPSTHSYIAPAVRVPLIAEHYQSDAMPKAQNPHKSDSVIGKDGLGQSSNPSLLKAINAALANNHSIIEQRALFSQALQRSIIADADQELSLNLSASNSLKTSNSSHSASASFDLALNGSWQFDIWGELDKKSKAAHYTLAQAKASLQYAEQSLIADITTAWYQLIYQQQRQQLIIEQQQNTDNQRQTIEFSYSKGLSDISDVYLARANLDSAKLRTSSGAQALSNTARQLQLLIGQYPSGNLRIAGNFASLSINFKLGVPANLLKNRADLNSSWLAVMAQDATTASNYAKQFPSFNLSGALSLSSAKLSDLMSQNLAWSLLANISQSILDGGKTTANYRLARAVLIEREQEYLQVLQSAFSEIETLIEAQHAIEEQWQLNSQILKNSELSLEQISAQYQNGIANYQQVLNLQQQLFDDQKDQLLLNMQRIENRVELLLSLGNPNDINHTTESK